MSTPTPHGSGDGTRPTTSGGVDNIGAAEGFSTHRNAAGEEVSIPASKEAMQDKRQDAASARRDDSDPLDLHEDLAPDPNVEPASRQDVARRR